MNTAVDIVLGNPSGPPQSTNDYAEHLTKMMTEAYEGLREHLGRSAERVKKYYDFGGKPVQFEPGDQVWLYSPRQFHNNYRLLFMLL